MGLPNVGGDLMVMPQPVQSTRGQMIDMVNSSAGHSDTPDAVSTAPDRMLQCTFGNLNVHRKMEEDTCANGGLRTRGGFCEHIREQIEARGVHIIGIQEAHSPNGGTIMSDSHIRIVSGPHALNKRGDVEIWLARKLKWSAEGRCKALTRDSVSLVKAAQRFLIVNVHLDAVSFDVCCAHFPTTWQKRGPGSIELAKQHHLRTLRKL